MNASKTVCAWNNATASFYRVPAHNYMNYHFGNDHNVIHCPEYYTVVHSNNF